MGRQNLGVDDLKEGSRSW